MTSLLPNNSTPFERALEAAALSALDIDIDIIRKSTIVGEADSKFLPHLAYEKSADYWRDDWSDETKEAWISAQWDIHRKKGTVGAVNDALGALGYGAIIREWYNYGGDPYHFRVEIDLRSRDMWLLDDYRQIYEVCILAKPVRANLEEIRAFLEDTMPEPIIAIAGVSTMTMEIDWVD